MNSLLRCAIVSLAGFGLAACASQGGSGYQSTAPRVQPAHQSDYQKDSAYIAAVERTARMRGIDVRWVNPPVKRVARADNNGSQ